jgi:hypothetical protein
MNPRWQAAGLIVLLTTLASCGDKGTAPKPEVMAGTWTASKVEYVSRTSSSRVDLVAAGGSATLVLDAAGSFLYVETPAGGQPDSTAGSWHASADVLEMMPAGATYTRQFDYSFSANSLVLSGGGALYDFGSGLEEATLNLAFTR